MNQLDMLHKHIEKQKDTAFVIFRIFVGLLFAQHGAQKLFGWFTDKGAVELMSQMGAVGAIEFFGGLLVAIGLFTRLSALACMILSALIYFNSHFPNGWIPIMNRGELALLYFACFLVIFTHRTGFRMVKAIHH